MTRGEDVRSPFGSGRPAGGFCCVAPWQHTEQIHIALAKYAPRSASSPCAVRQARVSLLCYWAGVGDDGGTGRARFRFGWG